MKSNVDPMQNLDSDLEERKNSLARQNPSRTILVTLGLVLVPLFALLFTGSASAHDGQSSVIYLDIFPNGEVDGQVEHPIVLLNDFFGLDLDPDNSTADDIEAIQDQMIPFNTESLRITDPDGTQWPITFEGTDVVETANRMYAAFEFTVDRTFAAAPREFEVTYTGIFEDRAGHSGFVVISTDPVTGVFLNEGDFQPDLLTSADPTSTINLDDPNQLKAFTGTVSLGMEHIFIGTDHILFVLVLLLPAVMLFSATRGWEPVPTISAGLWRVLKIATMFTLAHSITLTLGGLQIIELPSKLVETVIALSIIATALHNLKPVFANREHLIAFAFGIFHGFGFAGLLSELGVGRGQRLISLLGFNLGVEIGQAFIILLLFPTLAMLRRTAAYPWILKIGSMVLGVIAGIWAVERIFETSLGVDDLLEKFTRAPRVFILVAITTAAAAAWRQLESGRGRLTRVAGNDEGASDAAEPSESVLV